jgi:alpha-tubulin suppressor-like RCC1 family protein
MLGNGATSYAMRPERVVGLEGVLVADVAAGGWHSMAISAEGGARRRHAPPQRPVCRAARTLAAVPCQHSTPEPRCEPGHFPFPDPPPLPPGPCDAEVYVWGRGEYGRLGLGDRAGSSRLRPQKVRALEGQRVVEGSCGGTHTMVVTDAGRCFIWGRGAFGRWAGAGREASGSFQS